MALRGLVIAAGLIVLAGCAHGGSSVAPPIPQDRGGLKNQVAAASVSIVNRFAGARGKDLKDADLDSYIDATVTGDDRKLAHRLMKLMPKNQRGDFLYFDPATNKKFSNNSELADASSIVPRMGKAPALLGTPSSRAISAARHVRDYSSSCGPDQPHTGTGPYGRMVSKCGFTGGIGFVNVACGTSFFVPGDQGDLYFEVSNGPGNTSEGGLQYNSDTSVQPYTAGLNAQIKNAGAKYACGQDLELAFGPVYNAGVFFYEVGNVPSSFDPRQFWSGSQEIAPNNAAWTFVAAPSWAQNSPGTDAAGVPSPCMNCAISKVTSIAQRGDQDDGSYFGADGYNQNQIHWMQVGFGNWLSGCQDGQLCTLAYAPNQSTYYGGDQYYYGQSQNFFVVQVDGPTPTGFGPWETYDGILLPGGALANKQRRPAGAFTAPTSPPNATPAPVPQPCSLDSYGYCVYATDRHTSTIPCYDQSGLRGRVLNGYTDYTITDSSGSNTAYTETFSNDGYCGGVTSWSPDEPSSVTGDPNLP